MKWKKKKIQTSQLIYLKKNKKKVGLEYFYLFITCIEEVA